MPIFLYILIYFYIKCIKEYDTFADVTESHTITISFKLETCDAHAVFTATPGTGKAPLTVSFDTAGSSGDLVFAWSDASGSAAVGPGEPITHTFETPGEYAVTLTATGTGGCEATYTISIKAHSYLPGDADGNDVVDIFDALRIAMHDVAKDVYIITDPLLLQALDVNEDGNVDIFDAVAIAIHDVGKPCACILDNN